MTVFSTQGPKCSPNRNNLGTTVLGDSVTFDLNLCKLLKVWEGALVISFTLTSLT